MRFDLTEKHWQATYKESEKATKDLHKKLLYLCQTVRNGENLLKTSCRKLATV